MAGVAVETADPIVVVNPEPDHVYVEAPLTVKFKVPPIQNGAFEPTVNVVTGGEVILTVFVKVVPQMALEIVTVYIPAHNPVI